MLLPKPFPDELLGSVIARAAAYSHYPFKTLLKMLTGTAKSSSGYFIPTAISEIAPLMGITPKQALWEHTLFPYAVTYMPSETQARLETELLRSGENPRITGPLVKSLMRCTPFRRLCPECSSEDAHKYGAVFWRRMHALPGVFRCPIHYVTLKNTRIRSKTTAVSLQLDKIELSSNGFTTPAELEVLVGRYSHMALNRVPSADIGVEKNYIDLVREKGYVLPNNKIAARHLASDFREAFSSNYLAAMDSDFSPSSYHAWPVQFSRKNGKDSLRPQRHILMQAFCDSGATSSSNHFYEKSGPKRMSFDAIDNETSRQLRDKISKLNTSDASLSTQLLLSELGVWQQYRHNSLQFPNTRILLEKYRSRRLNQS